jgi:amino acid transporter
MASLFVISLIVPSNDDNLFASYGTASTSPFVVAASRAGVKGVASLVNALILLSAFSSNNTSLFNGARALLGLALDGKAPKFFAKTHAWGIPYNGIAFIAIFMPLAYTALSSSATTVFYYFVSIVSASVLTDWFLICVATIRLHSALKAQNISPTRLPFVPWGQPYLSWYGAIGSFIVLLTSGFSLFIGEGLPNMTAVGFLTYYAAPILSFLAFAGHKIVKRTSWPKAKDLPVEPWLQHWADNPEPPKEKKTAWQTVKALFWA